MNMQSRKDLENDLAVLISVDRETGLKTEQ